MTTYNSEYFGEITIDVYGDIVIEGSAFKKIIHNPELIYKLSKLVNRENENITVVDKNGNMMDLTLYSEWGDHLMITPADDKIGELDLFIGPYGDGHYEEKINNFMKKCRDYYYNKYEIFADLVVSKNKRVQ